MEGYYRLRGYELESQLRVPTQCEKNYAMFVIVSKMFCVLFDNC